MGTWYTVKVQPEREERIKGLLEEQIRSHGLQDTIREILIPSVKVQDFRSRKKRITSEKTYPGYLFLEMDLTDEAFFVITEISGISGFVSADPLKPAPLPEEEMNRILQSMEEQKDKPKPKIEFEAGQRVRIKDGPFVNYEGVVEEIYPDKGLLKVNVHIFGRNTPVELEFNQVERL